MDEITTMQPMQLTIKGLNLLAKAQAGTVLNITRAVIGEGYMIAGQTIENLTYLIKEIPSHQTGTDDTSATVDITCAKAMENGYTNIRVKIQNGDKSFELREIGIMADDPDEGEIMYAYSNLGGKARPVPASEGKLYISHDINIAVITSNASNVNVNISLPAEVSYKEFEDHREAGVLDHADGSVTYDKLAIEVQREFTDARTKINEIENLLYKLMSKIKVDISYNISQGSGGYNIIVKPKVNYHERAEITATATYPTQTIDKSYVYIYYDYDSDKVLLECGTSVSGKFPQRPNGTILALVISDNSDCGDYEYHGLIVKNDDGYAEIVE